MKTIDLINKTLDRLYATNDTEKITSYFAPYLDVSRKQLSAWRKTGKFPPEIGQACWEQEIDLEDNPTPNPEAEDRILTPEGVRQERLRSAEVHSGQDRRERPPQVVTEPDPSSEFIDPNTEETQPGNMLGQGYQPRDPKTGLPVQFVRPARVSGQRHNDIRVREAAERGRTPDTEMIDAPMDVSEAAIARGVELALRRLGLAAPANGTIVEREPGPEQAPPPATRVSKMRARMGDNWNTPQRRPIMVQQ